MVAAGPVRLVGRAEVGVLNNVRGPYDRPESGGQDSVCPRRQCSNDEGRGRKRASSARTLPQRGEISNVRMTRYIPANMGRRSGRYPRSVMAEIVEPLNPSDLRRCTMPTPSPASEEYRRDADGCTNQPARDDGNSGARSALNGRGLRVTNWCGGAEGESVNAHHAAHHRPLGILLEEGNSEVNEDCRAENPKMRSRAIERGATRSARRQ